LISPAKSSKKSASTTVLLNSSILTKLAATKVMSGAMFHILSLEDYRDYIKGFEWNVKKYMYSKPLLELCGEITKVGIQ
jgi:hypothetical protein